MDRRRFLSTIGCGVVAVPLIARAQTATAVRRIGWLASGSPPAADFFERRDAALRELGWIVGKNLRIEERYGSAEMLPLLAAELVSSKVELIVTQGTPATLAAKNATAAITIVMWSAGDPVASGLVASLARPGGNVTGYALLGPESDVKRLSLLRELLPSVQRVGELENSTNPYFRTARKHLEQAYKSLGMQPIFVEVTEASNLEQAVTDIARQRAQALHVTNDPLFIDNATAVMRTTLRHALPTIVDRVELFEAGGLLSYNFNVAEIQRRGAAFIDRVLRGAKPGELPIEQPTKFDIGINLKTAKALGIVVPQSLLLRADRVIE